MKRLIAITPIFIAILLGLIYFDRKINSDDKVQSENISKHLEEKPESSQPQNTELTLPTTKHVKNNTMHSTENGIKANKQSNDLADLEERYRRISNNDNYPTLSSRLSVINERRPNANISPEDVVNALEKTQAWETREEPGLVEQKLSDIELNDGRTFIEFDPIKVETLMPDDHMDIDIDSIGRTLEMKVQSVEVFSDENIVWRGEIINQGGTDAENGSIIITQSPNITLASIVLHDKDYTLESYGTDGWVSNSGALYRIDPDGQH